MKKTKIVCTIGPKTESVEMLTNLVENGMNVMRLNHQLMIIQKRCIFYRWILFLFL